MINSIEFGDAKNSIEIFPNIVSNVFGARTVFARFKEGNNSLSGLPTNYEKYLILYEDTSEPTLENFDSILQWKDAKTLDICDQNNSVALGLLGLLERHDDLTKLTQLERIGFFAPNATDQLDHKLIHKYLPSLKSSILGNVDGCDGAFAKMSRNDYSWMD